MNLYLFHADPNALYGYERADAVPIAAWTKIKNTYHGNGWDIPEVLSNTVMKDPGLAVLYSRTYLDGTWPEAEHIIATDARAAWDYKYMRPTSGPLERWIEAEPAIMKDPYVAAHYAMVVLKRRWPEAEPYIMTDAWNITGYASKVIKGRWLEAEPYILKSGSSFVVEYATSVIKHRWPEGEKAILAKGDEPGNSASYAACRYASTLINGRWPEAEDIIKQSPAASVHYVTSNIQRPVQPDGEWDRIMKKAKDDYWIYEKWLSDWRARQSRDNE